MNRQAFIFDLDGTLLDSLGMWSELTSRFLRANGIAPPPDIDRMVKPMTVSEATAYVIQQFHLPLTVEDAIRQVGQMATDAYLHELELKPGAIRFLKAAAEHQIPCALATVTYPALLPALLQKHGIAPYFRTVLTAEHFPEGKSNAEMYLEAARQLGTAPEDTLVFEDALYAAKTAKSAGFPVIGIRDAAAPEEWAELETVCESVADNWTSILTQIFAE